MGRSGLIAFVVACVALAEHALGQCTLPPTPKILAPDAVTDGSFGFSVDVDGNRMLVGAPGQTPGGAAYLYERQGSDWVFTRKFSVTGIGSAQFGFAVALSGNRVAIAAPNETAPSGSKGTVHTFEFDGAQWNGEPALFAPSGPGGSFGRALELRGDRLAIANLGEMSGSVSAGAAYVFDRVGTSWLQVAHLKPSELADNSSFGHSIAFEGNLVVVGAPDATATSSFKAGAAYVFSNPSGTWMQTGKLFAVDYPAQSGFGMSVGVDQGRIAVGATQYARAHVFEQLGIFWLQTATLVAPDSSGAHAESLALVGDHLLVSTNRQDFAENKPGGAGYLWKRTPTGWQFDVKVWQVPANPDGQFGWASDLAGDTIVVGAYNDAGIVPKTGSVFSLSASASSAALPPADYGIGCSGSGGFVPAYSLPLSLNGCFSPGASVSFRIEKGVGGSTGVLFYGLSTTSLPMSGSCSLLVTPSPLVVVVPLFGSGPGNGSILFSAAIPTAAPAVSIYSQAFIADPGVPHGFAATNGVRVTITP